MKVVLFLLPFAIAYAAAADPNAPKVLGCYEDGKRIECPTGMDACFVKAGKTGCQKRPADAQGKPLLGCGGTLINECLPTGPDCCCTGELCNAPARKCYVGAKDASKETDCQLGFKTCKIKDGVQSCWKTGGCGGKSFKCAADAADCCCDTDLCNGEANGAARLQLTLPICSSLVIGLLVAIKAL